jgi:hypothetical protein
MFFLMSGGFFAFRSQDEWVEYQPEHDPPFLQRIEQARQSIRASRNIKLENANEAHIADSAIAMAAFYDQHQ